MRDSTCLLPSCEPCHPPVTSCESNTITTIGTTNASTTTMTSCFGDLIGELCGSDSFIFSRLSPREYEGIRSAQFPDQIAEAAGHRRCAGVCRADRRYRVALATRSEERRVGKECRSR